MCPKRQDPDESSDSDRHGSLNGGVKVSLPGGAKVNANLGSRTWIAFCIAVVAIVYINGGI